MFDEMYEKMRNEGMVDDADEIYRKMGGDIEGFYAVNAVRIDPLSIDYRKGEYNGRSTGANIEAIASNVFGLEGDYLDLRVMGGQLHTTLYSGEFCFISIGKDCSPLGKAQSVADVANRKRYVMIGQTCSYFA